MIDIHCHLLPGLDDGPRTMDEAMAMARMAVADGIREVVCTPHWHPMLCPNEGAEIAVAVAVLRERLQVGSIPLQVWGGSELSLDMDLEPGLKEGRLATLNDGPWVLLELPVLFLPRDTERTLTSLLAQGLRVILAHPERYAYVRSDPSRLQGWVEMGLFVQITAASLLGNLGPELVSLCRVLLEHHLVHFVATDAHGASSRRPLLSAARDAAAGIVGPQTAARLVEDNPRAVLAGAPLCLESWAPVPLPHKKRPWFVFW